MATYAELHCHTHFSFLDGASAPDELVERAVELGLSGLAVTDHNGLYGVVRFATAAQEVGLRPVIVAGFTGLQKVCQVAEGNAGIDDVFDEKDVPTVDRGHVPPVTQRGAATSRRSRSSPVRGCRPARARPAPISPDIASHGKKICVESGRVSAGRISFCWLGTRPATAASAAS